METNEDEIETQEQISRLKNAIKDRPTNRSLETYESYVRDVLSLTGALRINFLHETIPTANFNEYLEARKRQTGEIPIWVDLGCGEAKALRDYNLEHGSKTLLVGVDLLDFPEFNSPKYTGREKFGLYGIKMI